MDELDTMDLLSQMTGAFFGAFAAFCLVILTDKRRFQKKKNNFNNLLTASRLLAESKLIFIEKAYKNFQKTPKPSITHFLPFSPSEIKKAESEILDDFDKEQILSIEAICFTMDTSDKILNGIVSKIENIHMLTATVGEHSPEKIELKQQVDDDYKIGIEIIKKVLDMLEKYNCMTISIK